MKRFLYALAALVLAAPLAAQAAEGWVIDDVSLQTGPDPAYPAITELPSGTPVSIQGCIEGWTWCDVVAGGDRGWVPGTFLEEDYGGQRVVIVDYGPRIGIPVVGFSLALYWDQHYRNRPFYSQRQQWVAKAIQPSQPPRPAKAVARMSTQQQGTSTAAASQSSAQLQMQQTKTQQQRTSTAATSQTSTQPQTQQKTQQPARTTQQTVATRAATPKRPETTPPEAGKQPSQAEKQDASREPTTVAKAKPRAGEPKPKDELKTPKPKQDKHDQGGDSGGGEH